MATKRELISDIELRVSGGTINADFDIDQRQISHWIDVVRDFLVTKQLTLDILANEGINPEYLSKVADLTVTTTTDTVATVDYDTYTLALTSDVLKLPKDMGIYYITTNDRQRLVRTTEDEIQMLEDLFYSQPSSTNMMWYKEGPRTIVIKGYDTATMDGVITFDVYIVEKYSGKDAQNWDAEYPISTDLEELMLDTVEQIALGERALPEDIHNDGIDE